MFSGNYISGPKKCRGKQGHNKPVQTKQIHLSSPLPYDKPPQSGIITSASSMAGLTRHTRCLLSRSDTENTPQNSGLPLRRKPIHPQGPAIQPNRDPLHLHEAVAVPLKPTPPPRSVSSGLSRRLDSTGTHVRQS